MRRSDFLRGGVALVGFHQGDLHVERSWGFGAGARVAGASGAGLASELSVRAFCAQQGVAEASFYSWKRELRLRDAGTPSAAAKSSAAARETAVGATAAGSTAAGATVFPPR